MALAWLMAPEAAGGSCACHPLNAFSHELSLATVLIREMASRSRHAARTDGRRAYTRGAATSESGPIQPSLVAGCEHSFQAVPPRRPARQPTPAPPDRRGGRRTLDTRC